MGYGHTLCTGCIATMLAGQGQGREQGAALHEVPRGDIREAGGGRDPAEKFALTVLEESLNQFAESEPVILCIAVHLFRGISISLANE